MRCALVAAHLALALAAHAAAADAVGPTRIEVVPNFHAASVYAFFEGDDDRDATVRMEYRAGGAAEWREGHPLSRTGPSRSCAGGRFAGTIFYLVPDRPLEVRVMFADPDGVADGAPAALTAQARTRSETFPTGSGKTYYVGPEGDDSNPGTKENPFRTIQHAADLAEPGDAIYLADGTYRESVTVRRSGRPDAYILLRPDPEDRARPMRMHRTDGYGAEKRFPSRAHLAGWVLAEGTWEDLGDGLFALAEKRPVGTVTMTLPPEGAYRPAGTRIYHHGSLDELKAARAPLLPGWWHDAKAGRLYVRIDPSAAPRSPTAVTVRLGVLGVGLRFEGAAYWVVERLEFACFGGGSYPRGIEVSGGSDIVIRRCQFDVMRTGIYIRRNAARCLVEGCAFRDTSIFDWPWDACKSHDVEGAAVSLAAGPGCVVRHNDVRGLFNGICPATWGDLENDAVNADMDVHHNTFTELGDDPMEPEGSCMNVRFWHNATFNTLQGISLAPITVGPCYVLRDRYVNFKQGAVKVSVNSRGVVFVYHVLGWQGRPGGSATCVCGPWDNMHFRNSILRGTQYAVEDAQPHPIGCSFDYCCLYAARGAPFVKWSGQRYSRLEDLPRDQGFGPNNLCVEPYGRVEDGRPADLADDLIDAGVVIPGINDGFKGGGPDLGPDEVR